jgi:hypothetical protein
MTEKVRIEQALYGYRDGHHLVASSVSIAPRTSQFLATVTDSSGSEDARGFEIAYTGLPVPETDYYALFCTWPAPEMPRPGCVWSHVLLLSSADLARLSDLSFLRGLCLRPAAPPGLTSYEVPLTVDPPEAALRLTDPQEQRLAACLVPVLYGNPGSGVVVLDEASQGWEAILFALWSQQWPRLRRDFAFSTGSLGDRRMVQAPFDVQVAPRSTQRLWGRAGPQTVVVEPVLQPVADSSWVRTVLEDLAVGSSGALRRFLLAYGRDVDSPRHAFSRLTECFVGPPGGAEEDPGDRLIQVATAFPVATEALSLKRARLAESAIGSASTDLDPLWAVVYFLVGTDASAAFENVPFDFEEHARNLWSGKRADVLGLVGTLPNTGRASDFLRALSSVLLPGDVPALWYEQAKALPRLLSLRPTLAAHFEAWAMPEPGQRALWDAMRQATDDPEVWACICAAMLRSQSTFSERETVALAGDALPHKLEQWLGAGNLRLPSSTWRQALQAPLLHALAKDQLSSRLLALAAWVLPTSRARSLPGERPDVRMLAERGLIELPEALLLPTAFWLVALGLQTRGDAGFALLSRSFFLVYQATARSQYPGEAWEMVAPVLPELPFRLGWDRCRRLRRAVRRWFRENPGYENAMSDAAPNAEGRQLIDRLR